MQYTFESQNRRGLCLATVQFTGEGREKRWARRMNRFYEALVRAVQAYANDSLQGERHSLYICRMETQPVDDGILVRVALVQKRPGVVSSHKEMRHHWQKGVLLEISET